uniref:RNA-directed RNA polymerase n=1 Tax=Zygentoman tombus-related virus TaxID=2822552 RepID=A0A8A6RQ69_9TOMB|nr:RNA-dependent RNA polymerase [Zygentoman tombus-related virus]
MLGQSNVQCDFTEILSNQHRSSIYTKCGGKISTKGTRASGDVNTSLGNTVVQLVSTIWVLQSLHISQYRIYLDGDDALIFVKPHFISILSDSAPGFYKLLGLKTKIEGIAYHYNELRYCSGIFVHTNSGVRHIRNPGKMLATAPYALEALKPHLARERGAQVARCAAIFHGNVPVVGALCKQWVRAAGAPRKDYSQWHPDVQRKIMGQQLNSIDFSEPTETGRADFQAATGIPIHEQISCERYLLGLAIYSPTQRLDHPVLRRLIEDYLGHMIDHFDRYELQDSCCPPRFSPDTHCSERGEVCPPEQQPPPPACSAEGTQECPPSRAHSPWPSRQPKVAKGNRLFNIDRNRVDTVVGIHHNKHTKLHSLRRLERQHPRPSHGAGPRKFCHFRGQNGIPPASAGYGALGKGRGGLENLVAP